MGERTAAPQDPMYPWLGLNDCTLGEEGWLGNVNRCDDYTRDQARQRLAGELGERFIDITARKAYARLYDRQDAWEWWVETGPLDWDWVAAEPAPDWVPPEDAPCWREVEKDASGAVAVWLCEVSDA